MSLNVYIFHENTHKRTERDGAALGQRIGNPWLSGLGQQAPSYWIPGKSGNPYFRSHPGEPLTNFHWRPHRRNGPHPPKNCWISLGRTKWNGNQSYGNR